MDNLKTSFAFAILWCWTINFYPIIRLANIQFLIVFVSQYPFGANSSKILWLRFAYTSNGHWMRVPIQNVCNLIWFFEEECTRTSVTIGTKQWFLRECGRNPNRANKLVFLRVYAILPEISFFTRCRCISGHTHTHTFSIRQPSKLYVVYIYKF